MGMTVMLMTLTCLPGSPGTTFTPGSWSYSVFPATFYYFNTEFVQMGNDCMEFRKIQYSDHSVSLPPCSPISLHVATAVLSADHSGDGPFLLLRTSAAQFWFQTALLIVA